MGIEEFSHDSNLSTQSITISNCDNFSESDKEFMYGDVEIIEVDGTGVLPTYEDMHDIIGIYSEKANFVIFEVIEICSDEEKDRFVGLDANATTLYKARITYDCLNNESVNKIIYVAKSGNAKLQPANQPLYNIGEKYATMFMNLSYDSWNTPLPELTFAVKEENEELYLYQIRFDFMKFANKNGKQLGKALNKSEQYEYTTTRNNPVQYVKKYTLNEISDFFREDWKSREYKINRLNNEIFETDMFDYSYTDDGDVIPLS